MTSPDPCVETRDFFECTRRRLNPGGLFLFWLPLHMPPGALDAVLGAALRAYPRVTLWTVPICGGTFVQIVCSETGQTYSPAAIDRRMADPRVASDLAWMGIDSSVALLACYRGDEKDIGRCIEPGAVNTDDRPVVEFCVRRALFRDTAPAILRLLGPAREGSPLDHLDWRGLSAGERSAWLDRNAAARSAIVP